MTDYTCTTIPAEYTHGAHHDAVIGYVTWPEISHVEHTDAVIGYVHWPAITHVEHTDAVPGAWQEFSPNKDQGPLEGQPVWPSDARGTWSAPKTSGGPSQDQTGTFQQGNGNGSWFHRGVGTAASDVTVEDHAAWDEPYTVTPASDVTVVDHVAWDEPYTVTEAYDEPDVLVKAESEVCVPVKAPVSITPSDPASIVIEPTPPAEVASIVIEPPVAETVTAPIVTAPVVTAPVVATVAEVGTVVPAPMLAATGMDMGGVFVAAALVVSGIATLITRRVLA